MQLNMKQILFSILIFTCLNHISGQTVSENTAMQVAAGYHKAQTGKSANLTTRPGPALRNGNPAYYVCTPASGIGFVMGAKAICPPYFMTLRDC
jgi:hypothetical protein